jgi:hypothetical protein
VGGGAVVVELMAHVSKVRAEGPQHQGEGHVLTRQAHETCGRGGVGGGNLWAGRAMLGIVKRKWLSSGFTPKLR